jgi:hypothetical protein
VRHKRIERAPFFGSILSRQQESPYMPHTYDPGCFGGVGNFAGTSCVDKYVAACAPPITSQLESSPRGRPPRRPRPAQCKRLQLRNE